MKSLHPNFQRSRRMISAGFIAAVAGFFLFAPAPAILAKELPAPPAWYGPEMNAIMLYESGINEESSNPAGAVKTLLQARQDSSNAISEGGGANPVVLHNDAVIAQALATAQANAAKSSNNKNATQTQNSDGNKPVKPRGNHLQITIARR